MCDKKGGRYLKKSDKELESVCAAYTRTPRKSIRFGSTLLQIPCSTNHKVLDVKVIVYLTKVRDINNL